MNHWQPDDSGIWTNHVIGLGHLMLYNTPESLTDKQPLYNQISRLTITADVRLDNRDELYPLLRIHINQEKQIPDSALILALYQKYGTNCVKYIIGDFAFAIWDDTNQQLFCARDQMGVKPLFYYQDDNLFAFASEKKGILAIPSIDSAIDQQFLYNQLIFPPEQNTDTTLYQHIRRLKPATTLLLDVRSKRIQSTCYWTLDANKTTTLNSKQDYYDGLRYHFENAVQCRSRSAYPVGAELSGGLDSSGITGVAQAYLKEQGSSLITFSNVFPKGDIDQDLIKYDEQQYIDAVIKFNKIENAVFVNKKLWDDPIAEIDFSLQVNDGLDKWNPLWQLPSKKAAMDCNVRTLLSGFPGDQMVTSQSNAYALDYLDQKQYLRYFSASGTRQTKLHKLRPFIPPGILDVLAGFKTLTGFYNPYIKTASLMYHIPRKYKNDNTHLYKRDPLFKDISKSFRHAQKTTLLRSHVSLRMESETRYGTYFRLEPRFPMADIRLTQFYSAMPNALKYEGDIERSAFREAVKKYMPPLVQQRRGKLGSVAPFLFPDLKTKSHYVELLLKQMPENSIIKKEALLKRIEAVKKNEEKDGDPAQNFTLDTILPSLEVLRWMGNHFK